MLQFQSLDGDEASIAQLLGLTETYNYKHTEGQCDWVTSYSLQGFET